MMFREHPIQERFAAARAAGFQGVEIQVVDEGDPGTMAVAAREAGVEIVLINVDMGDLPARRRRAPAAVARPGSDWRTVAVPAVGPSVWSER
jgi:hydroxypyruvate isomerase